jgi:carbohydrate-binding DOMON domain-containing protein
MADNVGYTPGSGATVAADDIGGVLYQRIKPTFGADGSAVDVSSANPMPVADATAEDTRQSMVTLLTRMLNYFNAPMGYDKSLQRGRVTAVLESGTVTTVTTVTTCATVTNLSTIDTLQGRIQVYGANLSAWSDCVRSRIT